MQNRGVFLSFTLLKPNRFFYFTFFQGE